MKQEYEDLLERPHPVSRVRPQMPAAERAAQFSPFAALSGFEELIAQTELQTRAFAQEPERKEEKSGTIWQKTGERAGITGAEQI